MNRTTFLGLAVLLILTAPATAGDPPPQRDDFPRFHAQGHVLDATATPDEIRLSPRVAVAPRTGPRTSR